MVSPTQLSTPHGASHDTRSVRKSQRTPASNKRAAYEEAGAEEKSKKRMVKKEKSASSVVNRIWNSEDEVILLKGLTDYKAERGRESKIEWEPFHHFLGDSITAKFSKEQITSKIRKLKSGFFDHFGKIKKGIDSHSTTFSNAEAFELAMTIWEKNDHDNDQNMSKENEEALDENEAAENENTKEVQHSESDEEVLKEQNEVANAQPLTDNGAQQNEMGKELLQEENEVANVALKTIEKVIPEKGKAIHNVDGGVVKPNEKEKHDVHVEFCNVQDAFDTLISHDLSDHRKKVQVEKLKKLGSGMRRKLSEEWTAICDMDRELKIRKLEFSAILAEAAKEN